MSEHEYSKNAKGLCDHAFSKWIITEGTPPGRDDGCMLAVFDRTKRCHAVGAGETRLDASTNLTHDLTRNIRELLKIRRTVRALRDTLRAEAAEARAELSRQFFNSKKNG